VRLEKVTCAHGKRVMLDDSRAELPLRHLDASPCGATVFLVTEETDRGYAYGKLLAAQIASGERAQLIEDADA